MCEVKDVKAKQTSRSGNAKWRESRCTVRCSNKTCLSLFDEKAEMSDAQKRRSAAGERLCRACAEAKEKATRRENAETANRKRKAEADAKSLTCCAPGCGAVFWDTGHLSHAQKENHLRTEKNIRVACADCSKRGVTAKGVGDAAKRKAEALTCCAPGCGNIFWDTAHLKPEQVEEHRRKSATKVVCEECAKRGVTAKGVADAAKHLKRQLKCAACEKEFPRQDHVSDKEESEHFMRKK